MMVTNLLINVSATSPNRANERNGHMVEAILTIICYKVYTPSFIVTYGLSTKKWRLNYPRERRRNST